MENKKKNLLFGNKFCIKHVTVNRITEVFPIVLGRLLRSSPETPFSFRLDREVGRWCFFPAGMSALSQTECTHLSNLIIAVFYVILGRKPKSLAAQVIFSPLFLIVLDFRGEGRIRCLQVGATEAKTMNI